MLNRVASPRFPNSVYEVIFQRNQFTPAANGSINRTPSAESVVAAKLCLDGANTAGSALYFVNPTVPRKLGLPEPPLCGDHRGPRFLRVRRGKKPRPLVSAFYCAKAQQNGHVSPYLPVVVICASCMKCPDRELREKRMEISTRVC